MKRYLPWWIALLVGSEAIGILLGLWFFALFKQTVPPAVVTDFLRNTAQAAFISYGAGAGVVLFLWATASVGVARMLARVGRSKATPSTAS
jgi:hypothetical protein